MSSVLRPRGPRNASVYWRRRLLALLVVLIVPLTLAHLFFGGADTDSQAEAAPQSSQSPDPGSSPRPSAADPSGNPTPSSAPVSPSANAADGPAACQDTDIEVVVASDASAYPAGANPALTLTIRNVGGTDCLRDIGSGANEIIVTSGGQHAWSSDDCDPSQASNEQVLPAGAEATVTVTWERKLSAPGCSGAASPAQAGTYQAEGRNGQVVSEPVRFVLQ